jgi:hypothetical protein
MKPIIPFALLGALLAVGAADAAVTDPVGYITTTIAGNVAANPFGAATYVAPTLLETAVFAGASTVSPSGGAVITFSGGVPLALDATYVLEISDGTQEGWWSAIASSTATTITAADSFPAGLPANVSVSVRKFSTVGSLFGANSAGFTDIDGVDVNPPDEIQILDPVTQAAKTIVYVTGVAPSGWYDFVTSSAADAEIIYPGTSVKVVRYGVSSLPLVADGEVKTTKTQVDVYPSFNWLGQPLATGGTLGGMNFVTQLVQFDGVAANDFLEILSPTQVASQYVALIPGFGGVMADFVTTADSSAIPIAEGTGYVVQRSAPNTASVVTIPAQVIAP